MLSVFVIITNELPLHFFFVKRFFVIILAAMVFLRGETKYINKTPQEIPGQSRESLAHVFLS